MSRWPFILERPRRDRGTEFRQVAASSGPPMAEAMGWCEPTNYNTGLYSRAGDPDLYQKNEAGEMVRVKCMTIDELLRDL